MLTVAVRNGKEVAVLETTKMRNGNPHVLINLVWVAGREPSLRRKCKLGDGIGVHLLGVRRVVREGL